MHNVRFFSKSLGTVLRRLCRKGLVLLLLTCLVVGLPVAIAPAAEQLLSQGVAFSGITMAITAPEGDPVPRLLEDLLPGMEDISQYCRVVAMDRAGALESLEQGDVTAVLSLPEGFVEGILYGENPDVELIVSAEHPLEALLTLWVAQSASDMLSAVQSGIYAVIDQHNASTASNLTQDQVIAQINLRYINWTLNRQSMFRTSSVSATELLPVGLHYGLSLLGYLMLAVVPFFTPIFSGRWLRTQKRFRCTKRSWVGFYLCGIGACFAVIFTLLTTAQLRTLSQRMKDFPMDDPDRDLRPEDLTRLGFGQEMARRIVFNI